MQTASPPPPTYTPVAPSSSSRCAPLKRPPPPGCWVTDTPVLAWPPGSPGLSECQEAVLLLVDTGNDAPLHPLPPITDPRHTAVSIRIDLPGAPVEKAAPPKCTFPSFFLMCHVCSRGHVWSEGACVCRHHTLPPASRRLQPGSGFLSHPFFFSFFLSPPVRYAVD